MNALHRLSKSPKMLYQTNVPAQLPFLKRNESGKNLKSKMHPTRCTQINADP